MITIIRRLLSGNVIARLAYAGSNAKQSRPRGRPPLVITVDTLGRLAMTIALVFCLVVPAIADNDVEFEAIDDMTVSGTGGTKNDADLEVKGVTSLAGDTFIEAGVLAGPYGGFGTYENILTYSEQFNDNAWTKTDLAVTPVTANSTAAPDRATTADSIIDDGVGGGNISYTGVTATASTTYTFSVWLKGTSSQTVTLELDSDGSATDTTQSCELTTTWKRYSVSHTTESSSVSTIAAIINHTSTASDTIYAWGAQLEEGAAPGVYAKAESTAIAASRGVVSTGDIIMPSLKLSGGEITDTTGAVTVGSDLHVTGDGPHYISTGNVGIGTTSPGELLHIYGGTNPAIQIDSTDGVSETPILRLLADRSSDGDIAGMITSKNNGATAIGEFRFLRGSTDLKGDMAFYTSNAEQMRIDEDGNVGIGTTDPSSLLDVGGMSTDGSAVRLSGSGTVIGTSRTFDVNPTITADGSGSYDVYIADIRGTVIEAGSGAHGGFTGLRITAPTITGGVATLANAHSLYISGAPSATVTGGTYALYSAGGTNYFGGNVGIGLTNPTEELHVYGTDTEVRIESTGTSQSRLVLKTAAGAADPYIKFDSDGVDFSIGVNQDDSDKFMFSATSGLGTPKVTIQRDGSVGIGTTDPGYKLDVNGDLNLKTSVLRVAGSVGSDGQVLTSTGSAVAWEDTAAVYTDEDAVAAVEAETTLEFDAATTISTAEGALGLAPVAGSNLDITTSGAGDVVINTDQLVVDSSTGNVGIGTTSPGTVLHTKGNLTVEGASQTDTIVLSGDTAITSTGIYGYNSGGGTLIWELGDSFGIRLDDDSSGTDAYFGVGKDGAENSLFIVQENGKVGIGTTTPEAKLDVAGPLRVGTAGDVNIAHDLYFENTSAAAINSYGPLTITSGHPNSNYDLVLKGRGTGKVIVDDDFSATGNIELGDAVADTVTITGTVIGASPALLVDQDTADTIADFQDSGSSVFTIADGGDITTTGNFTMGNGKWIGSGSASGRMIFDSSTPDVSIVGGNVGIGTADPGSDKLKVQGSVNITSNITVGGTVDGKDIATYAAMLNEAETITADWVNTANPWADNEVADVLTVSGGTIGSNNISGTLTTTGALTIGDGGDTISIDTSDWDISTAGAMTGVAFDANATGNSLSNVDGADLTADTLDFTEFSDTLTIDVATTIASTLAATSLDLNVSPAGTAATPIGLEITPTWGIHATDQTLIGLKINAATNSNTDPGDALQAIDIANISATAGTETAITIGTGWDTAFDVGGTALSSSEVIILDGGIALSEITDSGTFTATTVDINGGAIDGTTIGAATPSTGAFTTLSSTGVTAIGNDSATVAVNSSDWDISTAGAMTGVAFDANATGNSIANIETADFASNVIDNDTGLAADSATRVPTQHAAKTYIDYAIAGLKWKQSVKVATDSAKTLASDFENTDTIDTIALVTGDRILIKDQSDAKENGIYIVTAGSPTRADDADPGSKLVSAAVFIEQGDTNEDTAWVCTNDAITFGSTLLTFVQFAGNALYTAGTGLTLSSNEFSLTTPVTAANGGTGIDSSGSTTGIPKVSTGTWTVNATQDDLGDGSTYKQYDPTSVAITGGTINSATVGAATPSTGAFTTLSSTGVTAIGNNSATVAVNSSDWDISTAGAMTGITGIANDDGYTQSGTSANTLTGTTTFSNANYSALFTGGNVGIGTTGPGDDLHIQKSTGATMRIENTGADAVEFAIDSNRSNAGDNLGLLYFDWNSNHVGYIRGVAGDDTTNKDEGDIAFHTAAGGSFSEIMRLTQEGSVGIGTADPGSDKLKVQGSANITSDITVGGTVDGKDIATYAAMLNEAETITADWVNTANPWADNEVANALTVSGGTIGSNNISGTLTTTGALTIGDGGDTISINTSDWDISTTGVITNASMSSTQLTDGGTISFDWVDDEVADALTVSGGTIGSNNISGTLTTTGALTIGDGGDTISINTSDWDISTAGAMTGITGISNNGAYTQSGTSANTFTGTSTFSNATYSALFTGGNVGIGTTGPGNDLHIGSASEGVDKGIRLSNSNHFWDIEALGTASGDQDMELAFAVNDGTPAMVIQRNGNVGIGTTGPLGKLHITSATGFDLTAGTATGQDNILLINEANDVGLGNYGPGISFGFPTAASNIARRYASIASVQTTADNDQIGLAFITHPGTESADALVEQVRIQHDGNVGIGTTGPREKLEVDGHILVTTGNRIGTPSQQNSIGFDDSYDSLHFYTNGAEQMTLYQSTGKLGVGDTTPDATLEVIDEGGDIFMISSAADNNGDFMIVDTSGNVGIGTTAPTEKLDVAGTIVTPTGMLQTPYGGFGRYQNMALNSEAINSWTKETKWTVTANNIAAPDGQTTAEKLDHGTTGTGYLYQYVSDTGIDGSAYTLSVWLKGNAGGETIPLIIQSRDASYGVLEQGTSSVTLATSWQRFSFTKTFTSPASDTATMLLVGFLDTGSTAYTAYAWGAQLEKSSTPGVYAKTTSSTVTASRGVISTGDILMPSLKLSGGTITDTTGAVTVGSDLHVTGDGPHYISQGNVGIGTTAPIGLLHVKGTSTSATDGLTIESPRPAVRFYETDATADENYQIEVSSGKLSFRANNDAFGSAVERMNLDEAGNLQFDGTLSADGTGDSYILGNVGIGTTAPGSKFAVNRDDTTRTDMRLENNAKTAAAELGAYQFFGLDAGDAVTQYAQIVGSVSSPTDAAEKGMIKFEAMDAGSLTARMTLNGGNVGIGTTGPGADLDITDTGPANLHIEAGGSGGLWELISHDGSDAFEIREDAGGTSRFGIKSGGDIYMATNNGNVGIGDTTPSVKLSIVSGTGDKEQIRFDRSDNLRYSSIYANVPSGAGIPGTISFRVHDAVTTTSQATVMTIKGDGNVGIGTTNPSSSFHVYDDAVTTLLERTSTQTNDVRGALTLLHTTTGDMADEFGAGLTFQIMDSADAKNNVGAIYAVRSNNNDATGDLVFKPAVSGTNTERMRITYDGSVGIGTTAPEAKLDVAGPLRVGTAGDVNIAHDLYFENTSAAAINSYGPLTITSGHPNSNYDLVLKGRGTGKVIVDGDFSATGNIELGDAVADTVTITGTIVGASPALLVDQTAADTIADFQDDGTSVFYIADGGNIGIGTTSPEQKLHVSGGKIIVDNNQWIGSNAAGGTDLSLLKVDASDNFLIGETSVMNNIIFQPGATEKMRITSAGNVGIGTTAPGYALELNDALGTDGYVAQFTNDSDAGILISRTANSGGIGLAFREAGSDRLEISVKDSGLPTFGSDVKMVVETSGNVGIGTTVPTVELQVKTSTGAAKSIFEVLADDDGKVVSIEKDATDDGRVVIYKGDGSIGTILNVDGTNYITGGNVGIGTTGPTDPLEVETSDDSIATFDGTGTYGGYIQFQRSGAVKGYIGSAYHLISGTAGYEDDFTIRAQDDLWLKSVGGDVLIPTGNVGIGTTAPAQRLDVSGALNLAHGSTKVTNGTFASDVSGWGNVGGSNSWVSGTLRLTTTGGVQYFTQSMTVESGKTYQVQFDISSVGTSTNRYAYVGTAQVAGAGYNAYVNQSSVTAGTHTYTFTATSNTLWLNFGINGADTNYADWDNISVVEMGNAYIAGNLEVDGDVTLGDNIAVDTVTINSTLLGGTGATALDFSNATGDVTFGGDLHVTGDGPHYISAGNVGIGTTGPSGLLHLNQVGDYQTTPTLAFGDGDTGIYEQVDDILTMTFSGSRKWKFTDTQITSNSTNVPSLQHETVSATNPTLVPNNTDLNTGIGWVSADKLSLIAGGTGAVTIDGGNVGIGTTSPASLLSLKGVVTDTDYTDTATPSDTFGMHIWNDGETDGNFASLSMVASNAVQTNQIGTFTVVSQNAGWAPDLHYSVRNNAAQDTYFTIQNDGNVGIGETAPDWPLHVKSADDTNIKIESTDAIARIEIGDDSDAIFITADGANSVMSMGFTPTVNAANLNVDINGNVGIGTTAPGEKLDVTGDIEVNGYTKFPTSSWGTPLVGVYGSRADYLSFVSGGGSAVGFRWADGDAIGTDTMALYDTGQLTLPITGSGAGLLIGGDVQIYRNAANVLRTPDSLVVDGNVGIGTTDPETKLHVAGGDIRLTYGASTQAIDLAQTSTGGVINIRDSNQTSVITLDGRDAGNPVYFNHGGNVGIGTTGPNAKLDVRGTGIIGDGVTAAASPGDLAVTDSGSDPTLSLHGSSGGKYFSIDANGTNNKVTFTNSMSGGGSMVMSGGKVGIGTTAPTEKLEVDGSIKLTGQIRQGSLGDVAEMMEISPIVTIAPQAADVVAIDITGGIKLADEANTTRVIGVVSTNPAQILMDELPNSVPVALSGTVPCKVTTENGPIYPGDLLTSSSKAGYAMKADPARVGTIIGKAVEPLEEGEGEILIFVTRQ